MKFALVIILVVFALAASVAGEPVCERAYTIEGCNHCCEQHGFQKGGIKYGGLTGERDSDGDPRYKIFCSCLIEA